MVCLSRQKSESVTHPHRSLHGAAGNTPRQAPARSRGAALAVVAPSPGAYCMKARCRLRGLTSSNAGPISAVEGINNRLYALEPSLRSVLLPEERLNIS